MTVGESSGGVATRSRASQNRPALSGIQMDLVVRKRETDFERKTKSLPAQVLFHFCRIDRVLPHIRTINIVGMSLRALIIRMVDGYASAVVTEPAHSASLDIVPSRLMLQICFVVFRDPALVLAVHSSRKRGLI